MDPHPTDWELVIVDLPAEVDVTNAERVYDRLYEALMSGAAIVIADFTATTFCDSMGMNRLIMIQKRAAARDAQLWLVVPPAGSVRHALELLGLDQRIPVYSTVTEATGPLRAAIPEPSSSYSPRHDERRERRRTP